MKLLLWLHYSHYKADKEEHGRAFGLIPPTSIINYFKISRPNVCHVTDLITWSPTNVFVDRGWLKAYGVFLRSIFPWERVMRSEYPSPCESAFNHFAPPLDSMAGQPEVSISETGQLGSLEPPLGQWAVRPSATMATGYIKLRECLFNYILLSPSLPPLPSNGKIIDEGRWRYIKEKR